MPFRFAYPYEIVKDEDGRYLVTFPDVPEAGDDGETEVLAVEGAEGALLAALVGYVEDRRDLPKPSPARGRKTVALDPLSAAKLAVYQAMRERGLSNVAFARQLGVGETEVRRLLDLEHNSRIAFVNAALNLLDKRLVVEVDDAA